MAINRLNIRTSGYDEDAVTIDSSEELRNYGRLTTTGTIADGISAFADDASVTNYARIETGGDGAAGIIVVGEDARIDNRGTVITHGTTFDNGTHRQGDDLYADALTAYGSGYHVLNSGVVRVYGDIASAMSGIGDNGVLHNTGVIESFSAASAVIGLYGDASAAINDGTVVVRGDQSTGLACVGDDGSVINHGRVIVDGSSSCGLQTIGSGNAIVNDGIVTVTGEGTFAITLTGNRQTAQNEGRIDIHADGAGGLEADGAKGYGSGNDLINVGVISVHGVRAFGMVTGYSFGVISPTENNEIVNSGSIATHGDGGAGIVALGEAHTIINTGEITTDGGVDDDATFGPIHAAGILVSGDAILVRNGHGGSIISNDADSAAVELNVSMAGGSTAQSWVQFENDGLVRGVGDAILCGGGNEVIVNTGRIVGDVVLGAGNDEFVFGSGGVLKGELSLGNGPDAVDVEKGAGVAVVAHFIAGDSSGDLLALGAFFGSFAEAMDHASQHGGDVVFQLDSKDTLRLEQVQLSALNADDFSFQTAETSHHSMSLQASLHTDLHMTALALA